MQASLEQWYMQTFCVKLGKSAERQPPPGFPFPCSPLQASRVASPGSVRLLPPPGRGATALGQGDLGIRGIQLSVPSFSTQSCQ